MLRKGNVSIALALVLALVVSTTAFAAVPTGERMSNELTGSITVEGLTSPTIGVVRLAEKAVVGMYDIFGVTVAPGDFKDVLVKGKVTVTSMPTGADFKLEYLEQDPRNEPDYGKYLPMSFDSEGTAWFGPTSGFPIMEITELNASVFRATWNTAGMYNFTIALERVSDNVTLATKDINVEVAQGIALGLHWGGSDSWDTNPKAYNVKVGDQVTAEVTTRRTALASHLDHCLYIIELTKDGGAASTADFEIVGNPQGIMDTFTVESGVLRGHWGPATGFPFTSTTGVTTEMAVKFNNAGTYGLKIYAIQLAPASEVTMTDGMPAYWSLWP